LPEKSKSSSSIQSRLTICSHCHLVALVVFHQRRAEHFDLRLVPAGDDVQCKTAAGNVIDGLTLLGGHDRMNRRHVRGGENCRIFGRGADASGPRETFEPGAVEIRLATEPLPSADRNQSFELHGVA
jgi:hypothetical protein